MDRTDIVIIFAMSVLLMGIVIFWQKQNKESIRKAGKKKPRKRGKQTGTNDRVPTGYGEHNRWHDP
jgi:hypothetical protein